VQSISTALVAASEGYCYPIHRDKMAPLFVSCDKLSHTYSPFSTRGLHSIPGLQKRSVPFVRPSKNISRQHIVVSAAPEHAVENNDLSNNGTQSGDLHGVSAATSNGLLAVHGGEMDGRPNVSGRAFQIKFMASII